MRIVEARIIASHPMQVIGVRVPHSTIELSCHSHHIELYFVTECIVLLHSYGIHPVSLPRTGDWSQRSRLPCRQTGQGQYKALSLAPAYKRRCKQTIIIVSHLCSTGGHRPPSYLTTLFRCHLPSSSLFRQLYDICDPLGFSPVFVAFTCWGTVAEWLEPLSLWLSG